jgi:hypothetical protein
MARSTRIYLGASALLVIIVCASGKADAQIRINVPKIPKITGEKEKPATTGQPEERPVSSGTTPPARTSSTAGAFAINGGRPIPGAKVFFSTTPFADSSAGARTSFTSQEFIYGRLELDRSITEAFGLGNMPKRDYYYLRYHVLIGDDEASIGGNTGNHLYLSKEDVSRNFLNFDVFPDANNVNTVLAVIDELWNYKFPANLVSEHDVRSKFPTNGDYPIRVVLFQSNFDDYGEKRFDGEPLPYAAGQFTFQFAARDWPAMNANYKKADGKGFACLVGQDEGSGGRKTCPGADNRADQLVCSAMGPDIPREVCLGFLHAPRLERAEE